MLVILRVSYYVKIKACLGKTVQKLPKSLYDQNFTHKAGIKFCLFCGLKSQSAIFQPYRDRQKTINLLESINVWHYDIMYFCFFNCLPITERKQYTTDQTKFVKDIGRFAVKIIKSLS